MPSVYSAVPVDWANLVSNISSTEMDIVKRMDHRVGGQVKDNGICAFNIIDDVDNPWRNFTFYINF